MNDFLTNRCRFDEAHLRTAYRRTLRLTLLLQLALSLLCFGMAIYYTVRDFQLVQNNIVFLLLTLALYVLGAYYLWRLLTLPKRVARRYMDRIRERKQIDSFESMYRFTDTGVLTTDEVDADEDHFSYESVKQLVPCKELILFRTKAKQFLILDRTRFENGTEADFWRLMNEKCPNAVPKKYRQPADP